MENISYIEKTIRFVIGTAFAGGIPLSLMWIAARMADWVDRRDKKIK